MCSHLSWSLCWGRGLLEKGTKWRIGTGAAVAIYSDRWLPRLSTFQNVRSRYGLLKGFSYSCSASFQDFFFYCSKILGGKELELLCVVLWHVWFLRNQLVHGGGHQDMESVVSWAEEFLAKFYEANFVVVS
ncbi:hypothetical protein LWI29_037252 [Acer saccharum]|uniref:Uncharacterized protein n=1 Tax=Acer saccharum TaxID=4024 RepID=A0AA39S9D1_ACESA|nr:hypothetical protein LWI29_037252 [Acer saccharum]